jgi:hypothetical protein
MKKYITVKVHGIIMQVAMVIEGSYTEGVIECFLPDENTLTEKEEQEWIKQNNKRMAAICDFLNEKGL